MEKDYECINCIENSQQRWLTANSCCDFNSYHQILGADAKTMSKLATAFEGSINLMLAVILKLYLPHSSQDHKL